MFFPSNSMCGSQLHADSVNELICIHVILGEFSIVYKAYYVPHQSKTDLVAVKTLKGTIVVFSPSYKLQADSRDTCFLQWSESKSQNPEHF